MFRLAIAALLSVMLAAPLAAQEASDAPPPPDRSATGGAQTLEDILRRQEGLKVDDAFRREATGNPDIAAPTTEQLGTLGGASDPDLWRAVRFNSADVSVSAGGDVATVLMQENGMAWTTFREGPLTTYGNGLLIFTIVTLILFYLIRGKIRIDGEKTGRKILRFNSIERFAHWLLAGSFIVLGITGIVLLIGRQVLIPVFGHEANAILTGYGKWIHNNVGWAFILAIVMIFVLWVVDNLPSRTDLVWLAKGGGIFTKGVHPPAKKFNAGQKFIFWSVVVFGTSISLTGVALLFPFELNMFAATFEKLNALGLPQMVGLGELRTDLAPQEEMQYAQAWHAILAFVLMAIIIAHIYIGSVGMEGAYDAMGSGEVEEQWAKEHHSLWVEEVRAKEAKAPKGATPAE